MTDEVADEAAPDDAPADGESVGSAAARPAGRRPSPIVVVALAVLVLIGGVLALRWWNDRSYIGSTVDVTLEWDCWNGIGWRDMTRGGERGVFWYAGHNPAIVGSLPTSMDERAANGGLGLVRAKGTLHFDSYDDATFTSEAGGTVTLTRQPENRFYTADCAIGPQPR